MRARRRVAPSLALALAVTAMATSAMTAAMIWLEGGGGLWPGLVRYQGQLHHQLADALRAGNPIHAALVLGTLSLFYGVAHAVGPGTARLSLVPTCLPTGPRSGAE
jgi:hypothetical protein